MQPLQTETWQLAQINLAYGRFPVNSPEMRDFADAIDAINALADASAGFVWRYMTDSRDPQQREFADANVLFNMSVWRDLVSLQHFTYRSAHGPVFARRKDWFVPWPEAVRHLPEFPPGTPPVALWWVPAGTLPTPAQGIERLRWLGEHGPGSQAFSFKQAFSPSGVPIER
jgi:hypothetical protein